ncbi:MAG: replicative DNA helicase, partial [Clostridium sp.]|nr:replicative DNA helicase [Clostridium sp.]
MENRPLRIMPNNQEAEQSVIGSMILDKNAIASVLEKLQKDDFHRDGHQIIFQSVLDLFTRDVPIDLVTLADHLKSMDKLDYVGGVSYLTELASSVPTTLNLMSYVKIVSDKAMLRRLIRASTEIMDDSYSKQDEVDSVVEDAEKRIFNIAEKRNTGGFEPISTILERGFVEIERIFNNKGTTTGISTQFPELDKMTSGFQKGDMVLIAARPSMGKTTFALNLAEHAALREGKSVAIFSLEMSMDQLAYKFLCSEANVELTKLRNGDLDDKDWENIARASGPLSQAKIFIDDTAGISVTEMRSKCRRLKLEHGIDMILIDYLQLMSGKGESRQQEVSEISRSIKGLAKEMQCPVVALSQLSRAPEQRADHRPMLSDLRESGSIEQDAD